MMHGPININTLSVFVLVQFNIFAP